jgi:rhodanese-related sulfurtransferase
MDLVDSARKSIKEVNIEEVKNKLDTGHDFILLDIRTESEWAKGHIGGAKYIDRGVLEFHVEAQIPEKSAEVILYCAGGVRSALSVQTLEKMGYTNVASMLEGTNGWEAAGYPMID